MAIRKFYSNKEKAGWKPHGKKYSSWGFDIRLENGRRKRESGFASRTLAEAAAARIKLAEKNRKYELTDYTLFPTVGELFQKRIENLTEYGEKMRSLRVLQTLLDLIDAPDLRICELRSEHINLYTENRQKDKVVKDATINRDLRVVRACLNQAKTFFSGLDNFIPPTIRFLKVEKTRRERIVESVEVKAILLNLMKNRTDRESEAIYLSRRRAGYLFLLSAVTGARPGELIALKEADILEDLKVLRITGRKTRFKTAKTVRYFPLIEIVKKILAEAIAIKCGEYIFSRKGTLTETYYKPVRAACAASGIVYGRNVKGGLIPYDLRHTATTLIMHGGADFETVRSITGQSSSTLWHYTHANQNSIGAAVSILEKFAENCLENSDDGLGLDSDRKPKTLSANSAAI